jgi:cobalamin transport system substrate-binding protein
VIASGSANRTAIASLEKLDVSVFAVDPSSFDGTYDALRKLGAITGQSRQSEALVATMKQSLARIRTRVPRAATRPKVLWIIQVDPLIVVGRGNFMDDLVTLAGAENVGRSAGEGWPSLSPERLLLLRPDVILAGRETASRVRSRSGWEEVPALAKRRVYTLSSEEAVRPGPRLPEALEQLVSLLYPTKKQQPAARR